MNTTAVRHVSGQERYGNWPSGAAQYVAHFQQLRRKWRRRRMWSGGWRGGDTTSGGDFITTPDSFRACFQLPSSCCLLHLLLHLLLLLQYKTQIRFGCRLMRNLYAAQTVGHFFCFLFSPPPPAPPSRFRFRLGFVWPRQLALEEITIKLNGIQSYTTLEPTQEIRNASMTLLIL